MGKQFFICTGFINLVNKALFKWLVQGSPSTLPDPHIQSKLMNGQGSWWPVAEEGVCAVMLKSEGGVPSHSTRCHTFDHLRGGQSGSVLCFQQSTMRFHFRSSL